jgi:hypothetical protein
MSREKLNVLRINLIKPQISRNEHRQAVYVPVGLQMVHSFYIVYIKFRQFGHCI